MAQAFIWGQGGAHLTPEQVAQQRAIAEALMKEGSSYAPVGSWLEGLGRVANAAAGAFKEYRAGQAEKAGQDAWQQRFSAIAPSLGGSAYGDYTGAGSPAIPPSMPGSPGGSTVASGFVNGIPQNYFAATRGSESGGNPNAKNPNSSASGLYQFTDGTWSGLMKKYPALGLTADGRMDPAQQELAMQAFTLDNAEILKNSGVPISGGSLYAAHFLGAGSAPRVLTAPPETPMTSLVSSAVIKANPFLADMTAGDFAQWAAKKGGDGSAAATAMPEQGYNIPNTQTIPGDSWRLPGGANPRASDSQAEVAAALMGTNPDLMPQQATAMAPTQAGQQPMPQKPINTAGLNYDPATGAIGPAANLGAGATLAPAATEAFYGGQSPVQKTDTPILRQIAGLLGGGASMPTQGAPNGQQAVAQALAGQTAAPQGAVAPQGMPSIGQLMELAADPYAPEGAKAVVNALIQQQLQQQDPAYRMGLEKSQLELEQLRNPPPPKLDTFTGPDGTVYSFNPVTGANRPLTGAKADPGYRLLTPDEVSRQGLPAGAYQVGPDGKISQVGGSGVNVNLGNTPSKSVFDTVAARSEDARAAAAALPSFANARAAIDSGNIILGAGADLRLGMQKIGALLGLDPSAAENTETFRSAIAPVVLAAVRGLGAGTGISNADREFAEKAAGGNINLEPNSIRRLLDIGQRAAEAKIKTYNEMLDSVYAAGDPENDRVRALFAVPVPDLTPVVPAGTSRSPLGLGTDKAKVDELLKKYGGQ